MQERKRLFSDTRFGDLCRIGFGAIYRHADRYGLTVSFEHTRDAIQEAITECLEEGILVGEDLEDLEEKRDPIEDQKMKEIARRTVNAYRRFIHRTNKEEILNFILDDGEERDYLVQGVFPAPDRDLLIEDMRETLQDLCVGPCVTADTILELQVKGLTQKEIARAIGVARKTVSRRIEYLQDHMTIGLVKDALYPIPDRGIYRKAQKMTTGQKDPAAEYPVKAYRFSAAVLRILEIYREHGISSLQ